MPSKNRPKDSKPLRQTTLFQPTSSPSPNSSPAKASTSKRSSNSMSTTKRKRLMSDSSSDEISAIKLAPKVATKSNSDSDDSPVITQQGRKKRKTRVVNTSSSENEAPEKPPSASSDQEEEEHPVQKRRLRRKHSVEIKSESEAEDEDEDLATLANEVEKDKILDSRLRTRKKSSFQANLERLKKRKLKIQDRKDDDEEEEDSGSDESDSYTKPFKGSKPSGDIEIISDGDESDSTNSSAFIVEDGEAVQLPAEFSMETHQDLSHQFKKIFQFFVHIAIQSPKKRGRFMQSQMEEEEYFSVPLQVIRRKLLGLRDSLVASSVWRPEFKKSLERYPDFELVGLEFAVPSCDACHLGGRMSTLLGRLSGEPYNRMGFKDNPPHKSGKERVEEFHLGRFCARRTKVYHEFSHWEHSLFHIILREIDGLRDTQSSGGFRAVAFYGGIEPPENLDDPDAITEWLDQRKFVDREWHNMKNMMESARHLELGAKRGETDD